MASQSSQSPGETILKDLLLEYRDRISIDGSSRILCTSAATASHIAAQTRDIATPFGPKFTVITQQNENQDAAAAATTSELGDNVTFSQVDALMSKMDHFTHAIADVSAEDGRSLMELMKWAKYALQPKGIAVVIAVKGVGSEVSGGGGGSGEGGDLTERIVKQSKGRALSLSDVLEYAGFETGKIRSLEREAEVGGEKVKAEVVLAMKWDQLTA